MRLILNFTFIILVLFNVICEDKGISYYSSETHLAEVLDCDHIHSDHLAEVLDCDDNDSYQLPEYPKRYNAEEAYARHLFYLMLIFLFLFVLEILRTTIFCSELDKYVPPMRDTRIQKPCEICNENIQILKAIPCLHKYCVQCARKVFDEKKCFFCSEKVTKFQS